MKKPTNFKKILNNKKFKYGGYAAAMTIFAVVAVVLLNYFVSTLDEYFDFSADMTATRVYSLTQQTKTILDDLEQDVYIYTAYSKDTEDPYVQEILDNYMTKTNKIHLENIDVLVSPGSVAYYSTEGYSISAGSVIISTAEDINTKEQRFRILDNYDFYKTANESTVFDAEDSITGAIKFVINPDTPKVWFLDGHNKDVSFKYALKGMLEDENYEVDDINLVTNADDLEIGDILVSLAPDIDLSEEERVILTEYALKGGKMLLGLDPINSANFDLPLFESLLSLYNVELEDGIVIETDSNNVQFQDFMTIIPQINSHPVTSDIISNRMYLIMPFTQTLATGALSVPDVISDSSVEIKVILNTADSSFIEPFGGNMDGQPNEDARFDEFATMVAITNTDYEDEANDVQIIITSSPAMFIFASNLSAYCANDELFLNTIGWLSPGENDLYIRSKSLETSVLYIQSSGQAYLVIGIVLLIPLLILIAGIVIYLKRRHL